MVMSESPVTGLQTPAILRTPAGTSSSAGKAPGVASAWARAFEQAVQAGHPDTGGRHEPLRPLRTLAQPFANPPRWAPKRQDSAREPGQEDTGHLRRTGSVAAAGIDVDSSARNGATSRACDVPGVGNAAVPKVDSGAFPREGAAPSAGLTVAATLGLGRASRASAGPEAIPGQVDPVASTSVRRAFLSFASQDALHDLPADLPWQELPTPASDTSHAGARAAPAPSDEPLRLYAEWNERGVKVWVGANRSIDSAGLLPLLQRWVASRGERLVSFTCNGHCEFEATAGAAPSSPPPESRAADFLPVTLNQENPWQPVP